jgi:hypothetical protein
MLLKLPSRFLSLDIAMRSFMCYQKVLQWLSARGYFFLLIGKGHINTRLPPRDILALQRMGGAIAHNPAEAIHLSTIHSFK